jgi:hypothetical protein
MPTLHENADHIRSLYSQHLMSASSATAYGLVGLLMGFVNKVHTLDCFDCGHLILINTHLIFSLGDILSMLKVICLHHIVARASGVSLTFKCLAGSFDAVALSKFNCGRLCIESLGLSNCATTAHESCKGAIACSFLLQYKCCLRIGCSAVSEYPCLSRPEAFDTCHGVAG